MSERISCNECGVSILTSTADKTGGVCMPCKSGYRKQLDLQTLKRTEDNKFILTPAGKYWQELSSNIYEFNENFYRLSSDCKTFYAIGMLQLNVINGGFKQYFVRDAADSFLIAIRGLFEIGATENLCLVMRCKEVFFGMEPLPTSTDSRISFLQSHPRAEDQLLLIEVLEINFWNSLNSLNTKLARFAEIHGFV